MPSSNQYKNRHLLNRAGFGVNTEAISKLNSVSTDELYTLLRMSANHKPEYFNVASDAIKGLVMGVSDAVKAERERRLNDEEKKQLRTQSRQDLKSLNIEWLSEMVNSTAQLREKMALLWHGHFACRDINIFFQQKMLHEIRTHAIGNFGDLLKAVSKSASMLSFLNNQQNRKQQPNENFAREVMELFTLGRDNGYTEQDIKEAARAFTGWGFSLDGEFKFRPFFHDAGMKTVLGRTGNWTGDDVLDMLLEQRQTARYVAEKVYRFMVNEKVDEDIVRQLSKEFYESGYSLSKLLNAIFTSNWFYASKHIGSKIKSPVELIAGVRRLLPMQIGNNNVQLVLQRALGQVLFYPANVAGWPGGKNWIDTSSLMLRLRIPALIQDNADIGVEPKADDDVQMGVREALRFGGRGIGIQATVDWTSYTKQFDSVPSEKLYDVLESIVLATEPGTINQRNIDSIADDSSREAYIRSATLALMSTPEFQLY